MKYLIVLVLLSSCFFKSEEPVTSSSQTSLIQEGDIVVSNGGANGNKTVVLLSETGAFKATLLDLEAAESPLGLAWKADTNELLILVDGNPDRVMRISSTNGTVTQYIVNANLTGTLYGMGVLEDGSVLIVETSNVERFDSLGFRVTTGWPLALQTTGSDLKTMSGGGFVHCSSGTDRVRTYDDDGVQLQTTAASGIAATTDSFGCTELSDGRIALGWNGTTDTIEIRSADLLTIEASYSNTAVIGNPRSIAERPNGNILVVDQTANYLVELTTDGDLVGTMTGAHFSSPADILIIPEY